MGSLGDIKVMPMGLVPLLEETEDSLFSLSALPVSTNQEGRHPDTRKRATYQNATMLAP